MAIAAPTMKDLYKILGVSENADQTTIKKAYRKLAKENHPDVTGGDKKRPSASRRSTKRTMCWVIRRSVPPTPGSRTPQSAPTACRRGSIPKCSPGRLAAVGVRAGRGGAPFGGGMGVDVSDIFASLFGDAAGRRGTAPGGGGGRARARPSRGSDVAEALQVTFAEAALGTRRRVQTGTGGNIEVSIPPGVETGGRLRVAGQGAPAPSKEGIPGDLYIEITVLSDKHLQRVGTDVEIAVPVNVSEAALGAKVQVPTVEGPVTVTIPAGTSSGGKLRLRGRGIKRTDGTRGDQLCRIEIVVPKGAPDDEDLRRLFEEIGRRTGDKAVRDF